VVWLNGPAGSEIGKGERAMVVRGGSVPADWPGPFSKSGFKQVFQMNVISFLA
jgi:hypothetical protein